MGQLLKRAETARLIAKYRADMIRVRRRLHEYPELSNQEYESSRYLQQELQKQGIPFQVIGERSIVATIAGEKPGRTLVIRGDFDALPITEETGLPYASKKPGLMHACGHDCNAAMTLATGLVLQELRPHLQGNVKLLFQEGEENGSGAKIALESGLLEGTDHSLSIHLLPDRDTGTFITRYGIFCAYGLMAEIEITGKAGHPAHPDYTVNPIFSGMNMVNAINALLAYEIPPYETVVSSLLYFNAGKKGGSIPGSCSIGIIFKYLNETYTNYLQEKLQLIATLSALATGATAEVSFSQWLPPMINDPESVDRAARVVKALYGEEALLLTPPEFFADDFALIQQKYPGMMMNIGMAKDGGYTVGHNGCYLVDEDCLEYGLGFLVHYCLDYLGAWEA